MPPMPRDTNAYAASLMVPPPPGSPYALPIPGSEQPGCTPIYRNFRFVQGPVLQALDPEALTLHASFDKTAKRFPSQHCLGYRPWDGAKKIFENRLIWMDYAKVAERRQNFGAGVLQLHRQAGIGNDRYGVGLWSQNR